MNSLTLSQAINGYWLQAAVAGLSPNTLADYGNTFKKFEAHFNLQDPLIEEITRDDIREFLDSYRHLSKKTRRNYHTGLMSLWTWMINDGLTETHLPKQVEPPDPKPPVITPFTEQDVRLMLAACDRSRKYMRPGQLEKSDHALPNPLRNKAIIYLLLDTGIRNTELCRLMVKDLDIRNRRLTVKFGKGDKERTIPFSAQTAKSIWQYHNTRGDLKPTDPVIATKEGFPYVKQSLARLVSRIGKRAGVNNVHPHRFRHTFAITYLRNLGDPYTLQHILGHSDMTMVKRYLNIAQRDIDDVHGRASPVANWNI